MDFTLNQLLNSEQDLLVLHLLVEKYRLTPAQVNVLGEYEGELFARPLKIENLMSELPQLLKLDSATATGLVKDYVFERLLAGDDYFSGWPKKILRSFGCTTEDISAQRSKLENLLQKEFFSETVLENDAAKPVSGGYVTLDMATARQLVWSGLKEYLFELCGFKSQSETINSFNNTLFDYISEDEVVAKKNIAEIIKVLDTHTLRLGAQNISLTGQSVEPTVANWLSLFRSRIGQNWTDTLAIPKFVASHEAGLLKADDKAFLGRLVEFYRRLKGYPETLLALQEPDIGFVPVLDSSPAKVPFKPVLVAREVKMPVPIKPAFAPGLSAPLEASLAQDGLVKPVAVTDVKKIINESHDLKAPASTDLLDEDELNELSLHKISTTSVTNQKIDVAISDAELENKISAASQKNGVKFRDEAMQKRFVGIAVMFLKGLRDELETKEMILKPESAGGLGAPNAIIEPVMAMLKSLLVNKKLDQSLKQDAKEDLVVPKNFNYKNPLKQMLDAEATAAAVILSSPHARPVVNAERSTTGVIPTKVGIQTETKPVIQSKVEGSLGSASAVAKAMADRRDDKVMQTPPLQPITQNLKPNSMSDVTKPHPLVGGVEEMAYLTLSDFRRLGQTTEQRAARLSEKFELLKKEALAKFVSAIKAYRTSSLFQQYVKLGSASLGENKTLSQEIAGVVGGGDYLTMEEFDALADFHATLSY